MVVVFSCYYNQHSEFYEFCTCIILHFTPNRLISNFFLIKYQPLSDSEGTRQRPSFKVVTHWQL